MSENRHTAAPPNANFPEDNPEEYRVITGEVGLYGYASTLNHALIRLVYAREWETQAAWRIERRNADGTWITIDAELQETP